MTTQENRLAEIRKAIEAENVSYGELSELQDLAAERPELFADDPVLAEAAGIPEEKWRQGLKPVEITPGPWSVTEIFCNNACNRLVIKRKTWGGEVVADLGEAPDANRANARLIAAAPDLLAVLRRLDKWAEQDKTGAARDVQGIITEARQAIAKAEGRAE
jgi:hypothetical protein